MSESIYKSNELENEVSSDMSYFWYSDVAMAQILDHGLSPVGVGQCPDQLVSQTANSHFEGFT